MIIKLGRLAPGACVPANSEFFSTEVDTAVVVMVTLQDLQHMIQNFEKNGAIAMTIICPPVKPQQRPLVERWAAQGLDQFANTLPAHADPRKGEFSQKKGGKLLMPKGVG